MILAFLDHGLHGSFAFSISGLPSGLVKFLFPAINCLFSHCREQMERHEMLPLERGSVVIGKTASGQDANVSNAYDSLHKRNGLTEQASPKVRFVNSIELAELRQYTATFQFHPNILLLTYLLVELGDSGFV
jgi:hypothetical protein